MFFILFLTIKKIAKKNPLFLNHKKNIFFSFLFEWEIIK